MQKNVAGQKIRVFAFNKTTNSAVLSDSANITIKTSLDWAAAGSITDINPTETEDGYYLFDVTQAETNADNIDVYPESSTADVQVIGVPGTIVTTPANFPEMGIETDGDLTQVNSCVSNGDLVTASDIRTEIDSNSTQLSSLIASIANGTYGLSALQVLIDAIKTVTDAHTPQTGDSFARIGAPTGASVSADAAAIKAVVDATQAIVINLPEGVQKNVAYPNFKFVMVNSSDAPTTGLTVSANRMIDNGAFAACANAVTEKTNGAYTIDLAQADLNGDDILLRFNATGAKDLFFKIKTTV